MRMRTAATRDLGRGRVTALVSTELLDRRDSIVVSKGCRWDDFMRSGPALRWEHGHDPIQGLLPIGKVESLRLVDFGIEAEMSFGIDEFSRGLYEQYATGTLKSFSIDFRIDDRKCGPPSRSELRQNPHWEGARNIYRESELTGVSAVAYPSNPFATATSVRWQGMSSPEMADLIAETVVENCAPMIETYVRCLVGGSHRV